MSTTAFSSSKRCSQLQICGSRRDLGLGLPAVPAHLVTLSANKHGGGGGCFNGLSLSPELESELAAFTEDIMSIKAAYDDANERFYCSHAESSRLLLFYFL